MDIVKMITGNPSIKNMLLQKFTGMAKERGIKKIIIDLEKPELDIEELKPTDIIVDSRTYDFLLNFYHTHKKQL
jgi:hypothetical protein